MACPPCPFGSPEHPHRGAGTATRIVQDLERSLRRPTALQARIALSRRGSTRRRLEEHRPAKPVRSPHLQLRGLTPAPDGGGGVAGSHQLRHEGRASRSVLSRI